MEKLFQQKYILPPEMVILVTIVTCNSSELILVNVKITKYHYCLSVLRPNFNVVDSLARRLWHATTVGVLLEFCPDDPPAATSELNPGLMGASPLL